ncbi:hypothetical protein BT69DRAFT_1350309 [Atractiella rhizophila]|nr:hypothetical protein BT69DRAFT_1350309 [Atractiella rhizophila]
MEEPSAQSQVDSPSDTASTRPKSSSDCSPTGKTVIQSLTPGDHFTLAIQTPLPHSSSGGSTTQVPNTVRADKIPPLDNTNTSTPGRRKFEFVYPRMQGSRQDRFLATVQLRTYRALNHTQSKERDEYHPFNIVGNCPVTTIRFSNSSSGHGGLGMTGRNQQPITTENMKKFAEKYGTERYRDRKKREVMIEWEGRSKRKENVEKSYSLIFDQLDHHHRQQST